MAGFEFAYRLNGEAPNIVPIPVADSGDHSGGILANIETGEVDPAATNDGTLAGVILGPTNPDHDIKSMANAAMVDVIINEDAVYAITDANARVIGATLDINGAALAASNNADVVVVATSTASEKTLVRIAPGEHFMA